jgi:pimeloyl-ACP methyl ester carboxylesterase
MADSPAARWNHPGFGGSTGTPTPAREAEAIEAALGFATAAAAEGGLGYTVGRVVLLGWSIGGWSSRGPVCH